MIPEKYILACEKESVGPRQTRSHNYNTKYLGDEDLSRLLVVTKDTARIVGLKIQRIRMYGIAHLKKFIGRDNDEDRATIWTSKVYLEFLHDQAPELEKCLVFGELLTRQAHNWHSQLSRSKRYS